ncbi:phosphopantetheine-binding protein [Schaalia sp. lx-260]|uniref:phosphopantetheine-binding protein n=1 Tax=Schaalia sp. lx-260 TaxID=2899082 RepID=UPI001E3FC8A1|nr:phosphopantetheine-binding protein [Schaalia sp. lx-260]MCD4549333.1 phosphopantetheine-binding protein [Schaalia sp. lx-260]
MGTIAELIGYQLAVESLADENTPPSDTAAKKNSDDSDDSSPTDLTETEQAAALLSPIQQAQEIAMTALLAETGIEAQDMRADLTLRGDLDLDVIGLYAVISTIEHECRISFTDLEIHKWHTVEDFLQAVTEHVS